MTKDTFLDAVSFLNEDIIDRFIEKDEEFLKLQKEKRIRRKIFFKAISAAACVVIIIGGLFFYIPASKSTIFQGDTATTLEASNNHFITVHPSVNNSSSDTTLQIEITTPDTMSSVSESTADVTSEIEETTVETTPPVKETTVETTPPVKETTDETTQPIEESKESFPEFFNFSYISDLTREGKEDTLICNFDGKVKISLVRAELSYDEIWQEDLPLQETMEWGYYLKKSKSKVSDDSLVFWSLSYDRKSKSVVLSYKQFCFLSDGTVMTLETKTAEYSCENDQQIVDANSEYMAHAERLNLLITNDDEYDIYLLMEWSEGILKRGKTYSTALKDGFVYNVPFSVVTQKAKTVFDE